jgi:hypothetical protein
MDTKCQITGVILIHPDGDVCFAADLFEQGETYIANANENSAHTPEERYGKGVKWIRPTGDYWQRKGVWVFPVDSTEHSIAALEYMGK